MKHRFAAALQAAGFWLLLMMIALFPGPGTATGSEGSLLGFLDASQTDSLQVLNGKIRPGETLSNILASWDVSYRIINEIERLSQSVFDLRKIKSGNNYFIVNGSHPAHSIRYVIYEQNLIDYVVFKLDDPVNVFRKKNRFEIHKTEAAGVIETSLIDALSGAHFPRELAVQLTDLYAYILDCYHLQKGDYVKVVYNEKYVGGKPVAIENILAACFHHRGQDFFAFYFDQDSGGRYYDQKGNSLERSFLKSPLRYNTITSRFSTKRLHPILKYYRPHLGVDYAAPTGTPIMSIGDGIVQKAAYHRHYGNYVTVMHNGIYSTQYFHMSKIAKHIRPGVPVQKGEVIGHVGSTGLATGPHVELRLLKNGTPIDPLTEEMPPAQPLKTEFAALFHQQMTEHRRSLDNLAIIDRTFKGSLARE